jgi:hypothetical protein
MNKYFSKSYTMNNSGIYIGYAKYSINDNKYLGYILYNIMSDKYSVGVGEDFSWPQINGLNSFIEAEACLIQALLKKGYTQLPETLETLI